MNFWDDFPGMPEALERVSGCINSYITNTSPLLQKSLEGLFLNNGKLLRPGMFLLCAGFGKKLEEKHYKLAASLEMLHAATLIHDDIIDDSPVRRGLPAMHTLIGQKDAVLAGDYLLSRCILISGEYSSPENAQNVARLMAAICTQEIEQDNGRFVSNLSLRSYLRKITGKSAVLISLACYAGATEGGVKKDLAWRFRRAGYNIGMAFQIIDDILDYAGDEGLVAKPLGTDITSGIITLPVLCVYRKGNCPELNEILSKANFTADESKKILQLVRNNGGIEMAAEYAKLYTNRALREIEYLPKCRNRDMLVKLTNKLLVRKW
ncbi:MAG: polyprenyl synthetase family protein [Spirochaetaceae bacterium]|jgi:heptaprenyl diphosphate synthase|nr:polyprenyl synthetase family protein [Spirochaetaceae bacterium]